jgi:hypothetical protein
MTGDQLGVYGDEFFVLMVLDCGYAGALGVLLYSVLYASRYVMLLVA